MWSKQHYNAVAKELRDTMPVDWGPASDINSPKELKMREVEIGQRAIIADLALRFAKRFAEDNERFSPVQFLRACSPNPDLYPLEELWPTTES